MAAVGELDCQPLGSLGWVSRQVVGWSGGPPTDPLGSGPSTAKEDLQYVCLPIQGITLSGSHAHTRGHGNPHNSPSRTSSTTAPKRSLLVSTHRPHCVRRAGSPLAALSLKLDWSSFHSRPFLSLVGSRGVLPRRRQPDVLVLGVVELGGGATKPTEHLCAVGTTSQKMFSVAVRCFQSSG